MGIGKVAVVSVCAAFVCAGCVHEIETEDQYLGGVLEQSEYPPLKDAQLSLEIPGKREFIAGEPARIPFLLRNRGTKSVRIAEWYKNEPDNVTVYCQVWFPGAKEPDENLWIELEDERKEPALRYPLDLAPGNMTVVNKDLVFVENLVVSPGAERRYFLRGELNLQSVKLSSPVIAISVRAPEAARAPAE